MTSFQNDSTADNEQRVVRFARLERKFSEGDPARGREIGSVPRLDCPARRGEHCVDLLAGTLFVGLRHGRPFRAGSIGVVER
ncbi:MAG: hypothetical protein EXQ58_02925 [Acidobacteria bacterium]|nr:hypothetical protein [Acidobacteriota bacterium]